MNNNNLKPLPARSWQVVYTRSRWEKKVDRYLKDNNIVSFCPLIKKSSKWADRTKLIEIPLFSSYMFVYINNHEQTRVRQAPGIINFVVHGNKPVVVNEHEISRIHDIVKTYSDVETVNVGNINVGDTIKINNGPLVDCNGQVVQ